VRAVGVEPTRAVKPCGFSCPLRLSPPSPKRRWRKGGFVVWTIPSPSPVLRELGAARLVSTPSRRKYPSGLGSGSPFQVSPNLGSSASPVSRRALKFSSSPLRMPFRHARVAAIAYDSRAPGNLHLCFPSGLRGAGSPGGFLSSVLVWAPGRCSRPRPGGSCCAAHRISRSFRRPCAVFRDRAGVRLRAARRDARRPAGWASGQEKFLVGPSFRMGARERNSTEGNSTPD
jgi:hypothetical protein